MSVTAEGSSFSRSVRSQGDEERHASGSIFLWIAAILVLLGLNIASWLFCMWVFGQPEHPMNYNLLLKLDRISTIKGYSATTAPRGKFHSAKDLYSQIYAFNGSEIHAYNALLKRQYLRNYNRSEKVPFIAGEFEIEAVRTLGADDPYRSGIAIRGRATDFPEAAVDLILPSNDFELPLYLPKEKIKIEQASTCAAVINVYKDETGLAIFTAVPLIEREFNSPAGGRLATEIPERLYHDSVSWEPLSENGAAPQEEPLDESDSTSEEPSAESETE
ncbi:MAG: hypothetical protein AAF226_04395 [Verrucomicrobiota bacterium]